MKEIVKPEGIKETDDYDAYDQSVQDLMDVMQSVVSTSLSYNDLFTVRLLTLKFSFYGIITLGVDLDFVGQIGILATFGVEIVITNGERIGFKYNFLKFKGSSYTQKLESNVTTNIYLIGKVGSGKTSLLKTFYGELDVAAGDAEVLGYDMLHIKRKHIPQLRRKLGIVFQDFQLLTDRTVYDNLEFVLRATGWKNKGEIKDRISEVLQLVGMSNKGYKYPNELSGGEQQRIVIARAVLNSPEVILADEPTGNLDVETGFAITQLLHSISEAGSLVIMTTHNMQLLWEYPGRVYRCADHLITDVTEQYSVASSTEEK